MRVLACQIDVPETKSRIDRDHHVQRVADLIAMHFGQCGGADLILLPELATIDYSPAAFEKLGDLAESLDGTSVSVFARLAKNTGAFVCFGMPRRNEDGTYAISQIVIDPQGGLVGYYDKMHTAQFGESVEKPYFKAGRHVLTFDVAGVRVAPIICYDHRFPDLTTTLCRDHGVDVILHPVAFYRDPTYHSWHHFSITRAIENQVHLLSLNRAGKMYGSSIFAQPWLDDDHRPIVLGSEEICRLVDVDMAYTGEVRRQYTFAADRLDDYATLTDQAR